MPLKLTAKETAMVIAARKMEADKAKYAPPTCEECDEEMYEYVDPGTGKSGWACQPCGWSWDNK